LKNGSNKILDEIKSIGEDLLK